MTSLTLRGTLAVATLAVGAPVGANQLQIEIELPYLQVPSYRRPYVAAWIEQADTQDHAGDLLQWYSQSRTGEAGSRWLPQLRQWWRQSGSRLKLPVDGVSGATRGAGQHAVDVSQTDAVLDLPAGSYDVVVELVREHGTREVVRVPLYWPPKGTQRTRSSGTRELGSVRLIASP